MQLWPNSIDGVYISAIAGTVRALAAKQKAVSSAPRAGMIGLAGRRSESRPGRRVIARTGRGRAPSTD